MKTIIALVVLVLAPTIVMAGAIEEGRVRVEDFNLLSRVVQQLAVHDDDRLKPHVFQYDGKTFTYTLNEIRFLERVLTPSGPRNIIYVNYIRSEPYDPSIVASGRMHHFFLSVRDGGDIEFFGTTDASFRSDTSPLYKGILKMDNTFDLKTEKGWNAFKTLRPIN